MCCNKNHPVFSLAPCFSWLQLHCLLPGSHDLLYCQRARYCLSSRCCQFCNFTSLTAVLHHKSVQLYTLIAATLPNLCSAQSTSFKLSGFSVELKRRWCTVHAAHAAFPVNQRPATIKQSMQSVFFFKKYFIRGLGHQRLCTTWMWLYAKGSFEMETRYIQPLFVGCH